MRPFAVAAIFVTLLSHPPVTLAQAGRPPETASAVPLVEVERADRLLAIGDISGARRLYEYSAVKGSAVAATKLARTYDPEVLNHMHVTGGVTADPALAQFWYQKGVDMGDTNAASLLAALNARTR